MFTPAADNRGPLIVYRRPEVGKVYSLGADSMSGKDPAFLEGSDAESDPDWASLTVIDCSTGEQVAKMRERITPTAFARYCYLIGQWFHWAYLVPEANNHGQALIQEILRLNYPLDRIHVKRRLPGDRRPPMMNEIGFLTNSVSREMLVAEIDRAVNEMAVIVRDANTVAELRKFVIWPDGVAPAQKGKGNHDDDVFSLALAFHGIKFAQRLTREQMVDPKKLEANRRTAQVIRYGPYSRPHGLKLCDPFTKFLFLALCQLLPSTRRFYTGPEAMEQVTHFIEMEPACLGEAKHREPLNRIGPITSLAADPHGCV